jgi:hypothetical protein
MANNPRIEERSDEFSRLTRGASQIFIETTYILVNCLLTISTNKNKNFQQKTLKLMLLCVTKLPWKSTLRLY